LIQETLPPRLCSEIKLFDLCSLDKCSHKDGRYCTDPLMLERFEGISESEARFSTEFYGEEESEDSEDPESSDFYYDDMEEDEPGEY